MVDVAADEGFAESAVASMHALQCLVQASMPDAHPLQQLPHLGSRANAAAVASALGIGGADAASVLREAATAPPARLRAALTGPGGLSAARADEVLTLLRLLPCAGTPPRVRLFARRSAGGTEVELSTPAALPRGADAYIVRVSVPPPPQRRAYTPRLGGRSKDWGWWLVALQVAPSEVDVTPAGGGGAAHLSASLRGATLLALKRLGAGSEHALVIEGGSLAPASEGRGDAGLSTVRILLVSDCMRGIDVVRAL